MADSLASLVRAKYPGSYDDLSDADLEKAVLAKHPEYQDLATPTAPAKQATNVDLLKAAAQPGGVKSVMTEGEMVNPPGLLNRVNSMLTGPAHPTTAGDLLTSIVPSTMGVGGARQVVGSAADSAASSVAGKIADVVPTRAGAGAKFQEVMGAAKNAPVDVEAPGQVALRIQELADRGGSMPKPVRDFLKRITNPNLGELTYGEARDFASNISRLSVNEFNRLTPVVQREVASLRVSLNGAIANAAQAAGKGSEYFKAMQEYKHASQIRAMWDGFIKQATPAVLKGGAQGVGLYGVKKLYDWLSE